MRTIFNFSFISGAIIALGISACSQDQEGKIEGSTKYRLLNENQFLIEASGHWLTSSGMCAEEITVEGLADIKLTATEITRNGGSIQAGWEQIEDIDPLMRQIQKFARTCDAVDEDSINIAFLQLHTGPIKQVIAVSEQRHMFIVDTAGNVTYWRPFKDTSFNSLEINAESLAGINAEREPAKVDYVLGDEGDRFSIEE